MFPQATCTPQHTSNSSFIHPLELGLPPLLLSSHWEEQSECLQAWRWVSSLRWEGKRKKREIAEDNPQRERQEKCWINAYLKGIISDMQDKIYAREWYARLKAFVKNRMYDKIVLESNPPLGGLLQSHKLSCVVNGLVTSALQHAESVQVLQIRDTVPWSTTMVTKSTAPREPVPWFGIHQQTFSFKYSSASAVQGK